MDWSKRNRVSGWSPCLIPTGDVRALNRASLKWSGQFLLLLDDGDVLVPGRWPSMASALAADDDIDVLYSDEDRFIDIERPVQPHFKPDWDPDLLLSTAYLGRGLVIRTALLRSVGGYRAELAGAHEYDVMLRATESARRVAHLPLVLYHRRIRSGDPRSSTDLQQVDEIGRRDPRVDLGEARHRRTRGQAGPFPGAHHVRRRIASEPTVSVIIPFRDQAALTVACLDSWSGLRDGPSTRRCSSTMAARSPKRGPSRSRLENRQCHPGPRLSPSPSTGRPSTTWLRQQ